MPGAAVHTFKDLLLPNEEQDTRIILDLRQVTEGEITPETSSLSLPEWDPERLPRFGQLFEDLPSRMREHLGVIIDQHYSEQVAGATFTNQIGYSVTPNDVVQGLRSFCYHFKFNLSREISLRTVAEFVFYHAAVVYEALTGSMRRLDVDWEFQERTSNSSVITDHTLRFGDEIKILWAEKSSRAFDRFIGELMEQMRDRSPVELCSEPIATTYRSYEAILGKLGYHASDVQPRIRWAIVFSGLKYMIVYIPRTPGRPQLYCSPVMRFCLLPDDEHEPSIRLPIWSVLVYMHLVETLNIDDEALRQILGLVVPMEDPDLGPKIDARGLRCSGRTMEVDEIWSHSGKAAESITVQCLDGYYPMELLLANASRSPHAHAKQQYHPFLHFDRHLGVGWSSVFASSESHVVAKFAVAPKKDKAELMRQLSNEKAAYEKLNRIAGWIIPRLYGEYEWHGGRALVLSDEGRPLEIFTSLWLIERLFLFAEMYYIHYLGVEHMDFAPRNVLRKRWSCFLKIIDFGCSDVEHTCPGWRECGELDYVLRELRLEWMMNVGFELDLNHRLFFLTALIIPLLDLVLTSCIPANWRLLP